jgi:L-ascorbate metabolism protein UlaG (beta-lactamase superfamily)
MGEHRSVIGARTEQPAAEQTRRRVGFGEKRTWPASFADRLTDSIPATREVLELLRQGGFAQRDLSDVVRIPVKRTGELPSVTPDQTGVTWVGHATYLVRIGGLNVLTDPVWSPRIPGRIRRITPVGLPWEALPRVDAVVISHNHYDHLDGPTIRRLPRHTPILAPARLGKWFRRRGFTRVAELDWWENVELDGVEFNFVPAHHWSRRTPFDTCRTLWGGWVLSTPATKVYFAGDTAYGHWFGEIGRRHPGIDLALMPVGAYEPAWFMRRVHVNPAEAVRACDDLGARRMATMHWGTFVLSQEPLLAPVREAEAAWQATGRPREDLWTLAVGETRILTPRDA